MLLGIHDPASDAATRARQMYAGQRMRIPSLLTGWRATRPLLRWTGRTLANHRLLTAADSHRKHSAHSMINRSDEQRREYAELSSRTNSTEEASTSFAAGGAKEEWAAVLKGIDVDVPRTDAEARAARRHTRGRGRAAPPSRLRRAHAQLSQKGFA